ncbi:MAG: alcohol dehydrogenase catalytic domain-containing protein [Candidatus Bathyarchaeia archaeon]
MKAAVIAGKGRVELREFPIPRIGPDEILVHMQTCGICGTDLEKIAGEQITPPVLGHEVAGVVEKRGDNVRDVEVGENVAVHHHISCGSCTFCKNGLETLCEEYPKSNLDPCGFAEYFRVPAPLVKGGAVHRLPANVSFEEGSQVEPTACCIRGLRKANVRAGSSVAVFGVGPVGLTHVQLLRLYGAGVIFAVDILENRRLLASKLGADIVLDPGMNVLQTVLKQTNNLGVDYAVVATGSPRALESAIGVVHKGGNVLMFGVPARGALLSLDIGRLFLREITLQSSYSTSELEMRMALELIEQKRIDPTQMITHRLPLSKVLDAFHVAQDGKTAGKIIIENS